MSAGSDAVWASAPQAVASPIEQLARKSLPTRALGTANTANLVLDSDAARPMWDRRYGNRMVSLRPALMGHQEPRGE